MPEEKVQYQEADFSELAKSCGLTPTTNIPGVSAEEVSHLLSRPSPEPYWKLRFKGGCQDIFFLTTLGKTPEFVAVMSDLAQKHRHPLEDISVYIQPIVQGTSCHCEFNLFFDPEKEAEVAMVRELATDPVEALITRGAFFSRPYGPWADLSYRRDAETTAALRKLKEIFDPNDVMNPGKLCF